MLGGLFGGLLELFLFEHHVAVLDGVEDLSAMLTLYEFGVLVARDDAYLRMFALHGDGFKGRNGKILTRPGNRVNAVFRGKF